MGDRKPAKMSSMEHRGGWYALGVGAAISGMLVFWRCKAKSAPKFVQPSTGAVAGKVTDCEWMTFTHQRLQARQHKPSQSNFRVTAVVTFNQAGDSGIERFVVGHNGEACCLLNSCCAERSAFLQLGALDEVTVTGIYLVSDAPGPITPGALCREYMMSSPFCCPQTRVLMEGSEGEQTRVARTLAELWPHPSVYTRLTSKQQLAFGRKFAAEGTQRTPKDPLWAVALRLAKKACENDVRDELHPIRYGACIVWSDGQSAVASHVKALEYGCSIDPICQLAAAMQAQGELCKWEESALSNAVLVMADQFGVCHGPFAAARSFLSEHGWGKVKIMLHNEEGQLELHTVNELMPMLPQVKLCG